MREFAALVMVVIAFLVGFAIYCAWRSGEVQGRCQALYGPSTQVEWTGFGLTGECHRVGPGEPS